MSTAFDLDAFYAVAERVPYGDHPDVYLMTVQMESELKRQLASDGLEQPECSMLLGVCFESYHTIAAVRSRALELLRAGKRVTIIEP